MVTQAEVHGWAEWLDDVVGRLAPRFTRAEPRRRAAAYVRGLLAPNRKTSPGGCGNKIASTLHERFSQTASNSFSRGRDLSVPPDSWLPSPVFHRRVQHLLSPAQNHGIEPACNLQQTGSG